MRPQYVSKINEQYKVIYRSYDLNIWEGLSVKELKSAIEKWPDDARIFDISNEEAHVEVRFQTMQHEKEVK